MEWKDWNNKKVFIKLKQGDVYSGKIIDVDDSSKPIIFITLIDKFGQRVTVVTSELIKIKEEN